MDCKILVTAKQIVHTERGFLLVYDSTDEKREEILRLAKGLKKVDGIQFSEEITVNGSPLFLETKQRLALECFQYTSSVSEKDIALAVYRDFMASHCKIYRLLTRLSGNLREFGYGIYYRKGVWTLRKLEL